MWGARRRSTRSTPSAPKCRCTHLAPIGIRLRALSPTSSITLTIPVLCVRISSWIGTENRGLSRYHPETDTFSHYVHNPKSQNSVAGNYVPALLEDRSSRLWVGSFAGLSIFHPDTEQFSHVPSGTGATDALSHHHLRSLFEDSTGRVLVGTQPRGVNIWNPDTGTFTNLDVGDGLPSSNISSIIEDDTGAVWLATATYTNINPGQYRFQVRASTNGRDWVEGQNLLITIQPPPWRTWWAYVGYGLLVAALLWFAQKYITLRVKAELYRNRSITDPLTGLYNRAGIAQISEGMFANLETKRGACLMLMDIDHFKPIKDQRGHDTGDRILWEIATVAQRHLRANDHLGRWGGEEFVILCATKLPQDAYLLAEKVRQAIADQNYEPQNGAPLRVTVSIGVTSIRPDDTFDRALQRADQALYRAKAKGRNCVVVADE